MNIALLLSVKSAVAHREPDEVGLDVWEMIRGTGEARRVPVHSEIGSRNVVSRTHCPKGCSVPGRDRTELRALIRASQCHTRHSQVVDQPGLVPARLVVDNKQSRDVSENVNGRSDVIGICRFARFRFQNDSHGSDGRQPAVGSGGGAFGGVVDPRDNVGEDVRLKTGGVE